MRRKALYLTRNSLTGRQAEEYIDERHRHRYEVNPEMVEDLEAEGLRFVGRDETGTRMEIVELAPELDHPFFVGSQFHPEVGPELRLESWRMSELVV